MKNVPPFRQRRRAMTLAELIIGLTILTILSVGSSNFIIGGLQIDRALLDSDRQVSEIELAIRRMTHNIRTGTILSLTGTTSFTLVSQPDSTNGGTTYTITYTYDPNAKTLSESSTEYGSTPPTNVIAYNVSAFSVTQVSSGPIVLSIDMTIAATTNALATRRCFEVLNRNS